MPILMSPQILYTVTLDALSCATYVPSSVSLHAIDQVQELTTILKSHKLNSM